MFDRFFFGLFDRFVDRSPEAKRVKNDSSAAAANPASPVPNQHTDIPTASAANQSFDDAEASAQHTSATEWIQKLRIEVDLILGKLDEGQRAAALAPV